MPKFYAFKTIESFTVSAGSTTEKTWTSDNDYIIHKIRLVETTSVGLVNLETTITMNGYAITKDVVPGNVLDGYWNQLPTLDIEIKKSQVIKFSFENTSSSDITLYVVMELWK